MPFEPPTFNITANIYTGPWLMKAFREVVPCNLAYGRRTQISFLDFFGPGDFPGSSQSLLLLPALADVRSGTSSGQADVVEVPAGTGRWYQVASVDDIGKGFPNEHRAALVLQISQFANSTDYAGCFWPVPMP